MPHPKFELFRGKDDQFYFRLKTRNGETILASEGYTSKAGCQNGIEFVKTNAPDDSRYAKKIYSDDHYYFLLVAPNGETIGRSELYTTEGARENGIQSVKTNAPTAPVEDATS